MEGKMDFLSLKISIEKWANDKHLIKPENDFAQMCKTTEELGEMVKATLKNDKEGIIDGIGDVLITLIIFAAIKKLDIIECLNSAWTEIKDRKGKTVNGVFIKKTE